MNDARTTQAPPGGLKHAERSSLPLDIFFVAACSLVVARPMLDLTRDMTIGPFGVTDMVGGALVALASLGWLFGRAHSRKSRDPVLRFLLAFVLFALIVGLLKADAWTTPITLLSAALKILILPAAYCAFRHLESRRPGRTLKLFGVAAAPTFVLAVYQLWSGTGLKGSEYVAESDVLRVAGPFAHPNALAIFAALIGAMAFAVLMAGANSSAMSDNARVPSRWWLVLGALSIVALVPTYARVAWLALPAALAAMALMTRRFGVPFLAIGAATVGALLVVGASVETRLSGFSSITYRQVLWWHLLARLDPSDYLSGIGLGKVPFFVWDTTTRTGIPQVIQVHNDYLRLFIETGLIGAICYFLAIAGVAVYAWKYSRVSGGSADVHGARLAAAAVGATVVLLIVSLTDNVFDIAVLQMLYWGLAGAFMSKPVGIWGRPVRQKPPSSVTG